MAAVMLAAGLAATVVGRAAAPAPASWLAALGVATVAAAVAFRRNALVTAGVVLIGAAYGLARAGEPIDAAAALYGTGLLAVAELAFWSLELHGTGPAEPGGEQPRWRWIAAVLLAGAVISGVVVAVAAGTTMAGPGWEVAAAVAAVAAVAVLTGLGRRLGPAGR